MRKNSSIQQFHYLACTLSLISFNLDIYLGSKASEINFVYIASAKLDCMRALYQIF